MRPSAHDPTTMRHLVSAALLLTPLPTIHPLGYLKLPRSRNLVAYEDTVWWPRTETDPEPETTPQGLDRGGTLAQCGIVETLRNYDLPKNIFGDLMPINVQSVYDQEQEITVEVSLISSNGGHFQFSVCPIEWGEAPTQECFDANPLEFVKDNYYGAFEDPNFPERIYVPDGDVVGRVEDLSGFPGSKQEFSYQMNLPCGLTGDLVLLQWYFVTAQDCYHQGYLEYDFPSEWGDVFEEKINQCPSPLPPDGNGLPLQYWNCAEVQILKTGETERCAPTTPPSISPTKKVTKRPTPRPTTAEPTPSPVARTKKPTYIPTYQPTYSPTEVQPLGSCDEICLVPIEVDECLILFDDGAAPSLPQCLDPDGRTIHVGEVCEGSGECSTSDDVDNCPEGYDVYRRVVSCAKDDRGTTPEDTPVSLPVLENDVDGVGVGLTIVDYTQPERGSIDLGEDGVLVYKPNEGYSGPDRFEYSVVDGKGFLSDAKVEVEVTPFNDPPVANDDFATTLAGTNVNVPVLDNDSDPDDPLVIESVSQPENGVAGIRPDGTVVYKPEPGFVGEGTFTYKICDSDEQCDEATVAVEVLPPPNGPPVAEDDFVTISEGMSPGPQIPVLVNDEDPNGDRLKVTGVGEAENGAVVISEDEEGVVYSPNEGFTGMDSFQYTVCDLGGLCNTAMVTVTVEPSNNNPIVFDDKESTPEGEPIAVDVLDNDIPDIGLEVTEVTQPSNGMCEITEDGTVLYTPGEGFFGRDECTYTACTAGTVNCDGGTLIVDVIEAQPPLAVDDPVTTDKDQAVNVEPLKNDKSSSGSLLGLVDVTDGRNGTCITNGDDTVTYMPDPGYWGIDICLYTVCDENQLCDEGAIIIAVEDTNESPKARDDAVQTPYETPVQVDVKANDRDPNGDELTVTDITQGLHGQCSITGNNQVLYEPDPGYSGPDICPYVVCDTFNKCDTANVFIEVGAGPPAAEDDEAETAPEKPVIVDVIQNDSHPTELIEVTGVTSQPQNGFCEVIDGKVQYSPSVQYFGTDRCTYEVCVEGTEICSEADLVVDVVKPSEPPVAEHDQAKTAPYTPVIVDVVKNDSHPQNLPLEITDIVRQPESGSCEVIGGKLQYIPEPGFIGTDNCAYTVCVEGTTECDDATLTVDVITEPPVANDDKERTPIDTPVVSYVVGNDFNPSTNKPLEVKGVTQPENGSCDFSSDGFIQYSPEIGFQGESDQCTYTVCIEGTSACDEAKLVVDVVEAKIAEDDEVETPQNTPIVVDVLNNDSFSEDPEKQLEITKVTKPESGTCKVIDNQVQFMPEEGFDINQCEYTVCVKGTDMCDEGTLTVNIIPTVTESPTVRPSRKPVTKSPSAQPSREIVTESPQSRPSRKPTLKPIRRDNTKPFALDDYAVTPVNTPVGIDVLMNDFDFDGDELYVIETTEPSNGQVEINPNGTVIYIPRDDGFPGDDLFQYIVSDGNGGSAEATVVVSVHGPPPNPDTNAPTAWPTNFPTARPTMSPSILPTTHPTNPPSGKPTLKPTEMGNTNTKPFALDDYASTPAITPVVIDVLINDFDFDEDELSVIKTTEPSNGQVDINPDGTLAYTPNNGFSGDDLFKYTISDGNGGSAEATIVVSVIEPTRKTHAPTTRSTPRPSTEATCDDICFEPLEPSECPNCVPSILPPCLSSALEFGALCESNGECGLNDQLNNCDGTFDVYRRAPCPTTRPTVRPSTKASCDDICFEPLESNECPSCDPSILPSCSNSALEFGALCESNGECGLNDQLNNCDGMFDVYRRAPCQTTRPTVRPSDKSICDDICFEPLESTECSSCDPIVLPSCSNSALEYGALCESNGECGLDDQLNNCDGTFDVYRRTPCPTTSPTMGPSTKATCDDICFESLEPNECPSYNPIILPPCSNSALKFGALCESNGECGLDDQLNNCDGSFDVYRRAPCPIIKPAQPNPENNAPTSRPTLRASTKATCDDICFEALEPNECPSCDLNILPSCSNSALEFGALCESDGECDLDDQLNNCDGAFDVYRRAPCLSDAPNHAPEIPDICRPRNGEIVTISANSDAYIITDENKGFNKERILVNDFPKADGLVNWNLTEEICECVTIKKATLRLYVIDPSRAGGSVHVMNPTWDEDTITWQNAPESSGPPLQQIGRAANETWIDVDVTRLVSNSDEYVAVRIQAFMKNQVQYASKEYHQGQFSPQLVIEFGPPPVGIHLLAAHIDTSKHYERKLGRSSSRHSSSRSTSNKTPSKSSTPSKPGENDSSSNDDGSNGMESDILVCPDPNLKISLPRATSAYAAGDSTIVYGEIDKSFGSDVLLELSPPQCGNKHVMLNFDVRSLIASATVEYASILIHAIEGSDLSGATFLHAPVFDWLEGSVTWRNAPEYDKVIGSLNTIKNGMWYEVDVTSVIQNLSSDHLSIRVISSAVNDESCEHLRLIFASKELTGFGPQLVFVPYSGRESLGQSMRYPAHEQAIPIAFIDNISSSMEVQEVDFSNCSVGNAVPGGGVAIQPTDDSYVSPRRQRANHGTESKLFVDGRPGNTALVKFDLSCLQSRLITSAVLKVYSINASPSGGMFHILTHDYDSGWDENTVTWKNAPTSYNHFAELSEVKTGIWNELDITNALVGNIERFLTIIISSDSVNRVAYGAKESGYPPQLVLTHHEEQLIQPPSELVACLRPVAALLTFHPVDDALIKEAEGDTNFAHKPSLNARYGVGSRVDSLLKFAFYCVYGDNIVSQAILKLYCKNGTPRGGKISTVLGAWTEDVVTWNNAPTQPTPFNADIGRVRQDNWVKIDVTNAITSMQGYELTFRIEGLHENAATYGSKEDAIYAPTLEILF